jgi:membrane peptidoglycan carboxypeptidase
MQRIAQRVLDEHLGRTDPGAAVVLIEPGTGQVKAMAVNRDFRKFHVNLATGRGGTGLQGGSTFKVFVLAAGLAEKKIDLRTSFNAPARYVSPVFDEPLSGYYSNAGDSEAGYFDLAKATWHSVNTFFIQLEEHVGVVRAAEMARSLGVPIRKNITFKEGSFTLGSEQITPLESANVYATFAAHGRYCKPMAIQQVSFRTGKGLFTGKSDCKQVLDPNVADTVTALLEGVITKGTARRADIGRPAAGKTGTTQNFGAAWFTGYVPQLACSVGMGDTRGPKYPLHDIRGVRNVYGGTIPASIWHDVMAEVTATMPVADFAKPAAISNVDTPRIPDVRGLSVPEASAALTAAGFTVAVDPIPLDVEPVVPAGLVAATNPPAGTRAPRGSVITLRISSGNAPQPTPQPTVGPTDLPPGNHPSPTSSPSPQPTRPRKTKPPR